MLSLKGKSFNQSKTLWKNLQKVMVGGVNSPVRAFKNVNIAPIAIKKANACWIKDIDNHQYLDFLNSWGPLILGHAYPPVVKAIRKQASKGTSYGTITQYEYNLAQLIVNNIQHIDLVRLVNSGTEAVMTAIRLARGITNRNKIVKFESCYHGHSDSTLVKSGSGLITSQNESGNSAGIPVSTLQETLVLPLDDEQSLEDIFHKYPNEIAVIIIEPLPANSGLLPQRIEYLQKLREITKQHNTLLIFDEVITGFRLCFGGFTEKYQIIPDITTYGKVIGGGMPIGAIAGKEKIMSHLAPEGDIYQAGTLSGNPLAMVAGYATLQSLLQENVYEHLNYLSNYLVDLYHKNIMPIFSNKSIGVDIVVENSIFWLSIHDKSQQLPMRSADQISDKASALYSQIFEKCIQANIYIAPSSYEVGFLSYPMKKKHIEYLVSTLKKIFLEII